MAIRHSSIVGRLTAICVVAMTLAACQQSSSLPKDIRPVSSKLVSQMQKSGMSETSPIFVRIFKEESALEIWKQKRDGTYALLKTYEICKWSGALGPKVKEGDRQAPEGFYIVTPAQMNPKSNYYLSFNIGYPNSYDRAYGRTGSNLMVHGACSSSGCYSMTDADAGEIFAIARDAFKGGQREFQIQAFPFRMTPENFARHRDDPNMDFWRMLEIGYDHFEVTRKVPKIDVCGKRYVFNADAGNARFVATAKCPAYTVPAEIEAAVAAKQASDLQKYEVAVAKLENRALALQAEKQKAADDAAAAAADAAKPSLLSRWLGIGKEPAAEAAPAAPAVSPETTATPIATPSPAPRSKPQVDAKAAAPKPVTTANADPAPAKAPAPAAKPAPAVAASPAAPVDSGEALPQSTTAPAETKPQVVERKFLWPEDDAATTGSTTN